MQGPPLGWSFRISVLLKYSIRGSEKSIKKVLGTSTLENTI
jgi:hypothetical protein